MTKPVVVYGVSGYTGRLICEYLRELNVPFVAAGRDKNKVQAVVEPIAGIDDVLHDVVEVEHTVGALTELFNGRQGRQQHRRARSSSTATPSSRPAWPPVCHYLDTTGEQDWVIEAARRSGEPSTPSRDCWSSPGVAQMYTTGEIAAKICLETPGLDTLDIRCSGRASRPSRRRRRSVTSSRPMVLPRAEPVPAVAIDKGVLRSPSPASTSWARAPVGRHRPPGLVQATTRGWPT